MDRGVWWATAHGVRRVGHNVVTIPAPPPKGSTRMLVPYHHYSWWKKRGSLHIISHSKYFSPTSSQMRRRPFTTTMYRCFLFFFLNKREWVAIESHVGPEVLHLNNAKVPSSLGAKSLSCWSWPHGGNRSCHLWPQQMIEEGQAMGVEVGVKEWQRKERGALRDESLLGTNLRQTLWTKWLLAGNSGEMVYIIF